MRKINFSAGPSVLPDEVFEQMAKAMTDFEGSGLSIAEISHRSKEFMSVMAVSYTHLTLPTNSRV